MAEITVIGPDGRRFVFPEGTDPETMKAAMRRQYTGANARTREMIMTSQLPDPELQGVRDYLGREQLTEDIRSGRETAELEAAAGPENIAKERFYTAAQGQTLGAAPILQGAVNVPLAAVIYPFLTEEEKAGRGFGEFVSEMSSLGYDQARGNIARAREKRPLESAGIELGGGFLTGKTVYDELGRRFLANRAGARGAAVGAGAGGQYGFLESEGSAEQGVQGALIGAPLGAGLAKTFEATAEPLGRMFNRERPLVLGPEDEVLMLDRPVFAEDARAAESARRQTVGTDIDPTTRNQIISDRSKTERLAEIAKIQNVVDARRAELADFPMEREATRSEWKNAINAATRRINREYGRRYADLGSQISIASRGPQDYRTSVAEELADVILREQGIDPTKAKQEWIRPRQTNERAAELRKQAAETRAEMDARRDAMTDEDWSLEEFEDNFPDVNLSDFLRRAVEEERLNMPAEEMSSADILDLAGRYARRFDKKSGQNVTDLERVGKLIWEQGSPPGAYANEPKQKKASVFHGSPGKVEGPLRPSSDGLFGPGVYLTPDKTRAGAYAGQGGEIIEADVMGNLASYDDWKAATREAAKGMKPGTASMAQIQQKAIAALEEKGFVGIEAGDTVTVWKPESLKQKGSRNE